MGDLIEDYKLSLPLLPDILDTSLIIIGLKISTLEIDIYGYDYDFTRIKERLNKLEGKFPDFKFIIKRWDSVL